ncbi:AbrB family transcriptional regulator [Singulisphaera acidiphila]|uniref:Membrane protein AbrB duplication n=1 Tax=Singulisphaera acidiphila (strain ATCC BAA-1392 / DSM 18658 / VKM B-2454 / MOB10) TaxID=886293 RepID=L0DCQ3_SINAD|nr:AbrB family transcriptional regulator [Singulisphaera acidiphila]AGA26416.1 membrane protein AbrB duplication [Singulisphaera acidiphila DSM 18658]
MVQLAPPLTRLNRPLQRGLLVVGSAAFAILLRLAGLPAALMLGPMLAAVLFKVQGGTIQVNRHAYAAAQAIIGCLVARSITSGILAIIGKQWPILLAVTVTTVTASSLLGWLIGRWRVLPGTTAVWGLSPGAASNMILMAEVYGADSRLVALMQYLRVLVVAVTVSVMSGFWLDTSGKAIPATIWFPPIHWQPFAATMAIAIGGAILGGLSRIPAGMMLGPLIIGSVLQAANLVAIELPPWLLTASYAVMGWVIGLKFNRQILVHAARALLQTLLSILAMIAFCGGLAILLVRILGIDPLTAYLATSPGGVDSIAVIAASSKVDLEFVMALQLMRVAILLLVGPSISRFVAQRMEGGKNKTQPGCG